MANKYEARKEFIRKAGEKLVDYLGKGYLIIDEDGEAVTRVKQNGFGDEFGLTLNSTVIYTENPHLDNGYYTPLKELKQRIQTIKIVKPEHIIRISV